MERTPEDAETPVLDLQGDWLSLGGVDLQINGALGLAFPALQAGQEHRLTEICQFLWNQGIEAFLPTLVTTSVDNIQRSLQILSQFQKQSSTAPNAAQILGVHLEGPFLNPEKRGAHPQEHLLPLTLENVKRVLGNYATLVKIITLAPELDGTGEVIPYLRSLNIIVSLGHTQATAVQAQMAFSQGATMVTHAFNAMSELHHREPGVLGAAIVRRGVFSGLIADGQHVAPLMMDVLLRAGRGKLPHPSYPRGIFLVSDALAPLGLPDGIYPWDTRQIQVTHGTARLTNGTLAGTTLSLLVGVQNLVKWGICTPAEAIALATEAPRKALGIPGLGVGQPANLLHWQMDYSTGSLSWRRLSFD